MPHLTTKSLWQQNLKEELRTPQRDIRYANLHKIQFYGSTVSKSYDRWLVLYGNECEYHKLSKAVTTFKSTRTEYTQRPEGTKRSDSLARARMQVYRIVNCNTFAHGHYKPVFVTLTFRDNIRDLSLAHSCFAAFTRRLSKTIKKKVKYLAVSEFQERGAVHYHMVIFNLPWIQKERFEAIWSHGYAQLKATSGKDKINNVSAYMAKYMTKEMLDARLYGRKLYFCSRGLVRPYIEYAQNLIDDFMKSSIIKVVDLIETSNKTILKCKTSIFSPKGHMVHSLMKELENLRSMTISYSLMVSAP